MKKVTLLNVQLDNFTKSELLEELRFGGVVFTTNVDHLSKLQDSPEFCRAYNSATYRICDSQILIYASQFLGVPIQEKISGSDLLPAFYHYYKNDENIKIFLLGSARGIADQARKQINAKVGREMVVGAYSPSFGFEKNEEECQYIVNLINQSGATVLAVGVGAPKQEKWIYQHKLQLKNVRVFLAVGATIDFEAGYCKRSPKWMRERGLEWFYRLLSEPRRLWKRYLIDDVPVCWLILKQKLNFYRIPDYVGAVRHDHLPSMPIGQMLQGAGLLSQNQVETILLDQTKQRHLRFGEILAQRGWLKQETSDFFAEQLPKLATKPQKQPIGYYLKSAALLNENQVSTILKEQSQFGLRFGEMAALKGWVKQETVDFFLYYIFSGEQSPLRGLSREQLTSSA